MVTDDEDEIDLVAIARMLWSYKYFIAFSAAVCGVIAVVIALKATPVYRSEVVVTEVHEAGGTGGAAALVGQLGGLASLAGVNLGAGGGLGQEAAAVLDSRRLVEEFIKRNNLMAELFRNAKQPPTLWLAVKQFKEGVLTIRKDMRKGITTVGIEWSDPATAARWANGFVALSNEIIRARALDEAKRNIAYLNEQIAQTSVVELRKVMYNIIENETKTLMLANGRVEYAFEVVDPAVAPEIRIRPHRALMVLLGLILGGVIGIGMAFAHNKLGWHKRIPQSP